MGVTRDVDEPVLGILDRVARARETLRLAEERTGARTLRIVAGKSAGQSGDQTAEQDMRVPVLDRPAPDLPALDRPAPDLPVLDRPAPDLLALNLPTPGLPTPGLPTPDLPDAGALAAAQASPHALRDAAPGREARLRRERLADRLVSSERPALSVPPQLREILPDGLRRGSVTVVSGSTSLLLSLVAEVSRSGSWGALVGAPSINLLAAAQAGVDLTRFILVPAPGLESAVTVAALLDGMDIVVVGPEVVLVDADRRRLTARARERGSVVLAVRAWPGAGVTLTAERSRWSGLDAGHGRLRSRLLTVTRSGRSAAGIPLSSDLWLPQETSGALAAQPQSAQPPQAQPAQRAQPPFAQPQFAQPPQAQVG